MNNDRTTIHVTTKDRATEVAILLQSLRTQTYQDWDLMILDDASGTPLTNFHFFVALIQRIKLEGHKVKLLRNNISNGVCAARNRLIQEDTYNNEFVCRLDDDCIPESDYLFKLIHVIKCGYDLATGVIPLLMHPELVRPNTPKLICEHKLNEEGELIERKDELAFSYYKTDIVNCHQFRTNCLYKKEITNDIRYPKILTKTGFREELWFSFQAILKGYKIGADTGAVSFHLQTPSGGCRSQTYMENVQLDEQTTNKWIKKNKQKLNEVLR